MTREFPIRILCFNVFTNFDNHLSHKLFTLNLMPRRFINQTVLLTYLFVILKRLVFAGHCAFTSRTRENATLLTSSREDILMISTYLWSFIVRKEWEEGKLGQLSTQNLCFTLTENFPVRIRSLQFFYSPSRTTKHCRIKKEVVKNLSVVPFNRDVFHSKKFSFQKVEILTLGC